MAPGIEFAQIERAPDDIFLSYVIHYIKAGGKDLKTICSASSTMNRRCNQFRGVIESQLLARNDRVLFMRFKSAVSRDDIREVNYILSLGGSRFKHYLASTMYLGSPLSIHNLMMPGQFKPKSTAMMDVLFTLLPPTQYPYHVLFSLLNDSFFSQDVTKIVRYIFAQPGVRERYEQMGDDSIEYQMTLSKLLELDANQMPLLP